MRLAEMKPLAFLLCFKGVADASKPFPTGKNSQEISSVNPGDEFLLEQRLLV